MGKARRRKSSREYNRASTGPVRAAVLERGLAWREQRAGVWRTPLQGFGRRVLEGVHSKSSMIAWSRNAFDGKKNELRENSL